MVIKKCLNKHCHVFSEQQSTVPEKESAGRAGEVQQHHQHTLHRHTKEGEEFITVTHHIYSTVSYMLEGLHSDFFFFIQEMSPKDLETIENVKWDPPFPYDPVNGWKKSSINVKNYGRLIHSSKVRFRFLHCQVIFVVFSIREYKYSFVAYTGDK